MTRAGSWALRHALAASAASRLLRATAAACVALAGLVGCGESFGPGDEGAGGQGAGATATTTTGTTVTGTTTTVTNPVGSIGCADEERDGFIGLDDIAACSGGFSEAGLALEPACSRGGGDDGLNENGTGCAAADLCAAGWHVCESLQEVADRLAGTEECSLLISGFYATLVTADTAGVCGDQAEGGVAGCGAAEELLPADGACAPLTAVMTSSFCDSSEPWVCESTDPLATAKKLAPVDGGVLCCL
jgi:hypothetical protein